MKNILVLISEILNRLGINVRRYPDGDLRRRMKLLRHFEINKVLDVGANTGQYAQLLRRLKFKGEIISFEPISGVFQKLEKNAGKDKHWSAMNYAFGNYEGETTINIASNSISSSILEMMPSHLKSSPNSVFSRKEQIQIKKLDSVFHEFYKPGDNVMLKIDTQGFEKQVLEGAAESLTKLKGIQLEMSIIPLYEGQALLVEITEFLQNKGFTLCSLENGFVDQKTGQLLQVDGIFFRLN